MCKPPFTLVRSKSGKWVHATTISGSGIGSTYCGKRCDGWVITEPEVDCPACLRNGAARWSSK